MVLEKYKEIYHSLPPLPQKFLTTYVDMIEIQIIIVLVAKLNFIGSKHVPSCEKDP